MREEMFREHLTLKIFMVNFLKNIFLLYKNVEARQLCTMYKNVEIDIYVQFYQLYKNVEGCVHKCRRVRT